MPRKQLLCGSGTDLYCGTKDNPCASKASPRIPSPGSTTLHSRPNAFPTRSGARHASACMEADRKLAEIRQRESLSTTVSSQGEDVNEITFGDALLLQPPLPSPPHTIDNAEDYVAHGGQLCGGSRGGSYSSDSDSGCECPLPQNARRARARQEETSSSQAGATSPPNMVNVSNEAEVTGTSGHPAGFDPPGIIIISDEEDGVTGTSTQPTAVNPREIIIISDDEDLDAVQLVSYLLTRRLCSDG